jgi:hypothetical protein
MRDIRVDLQERLNTVAQKRAALHVILKELDTIESGINALLQLEGGYFAVSQNGNVNHVTVEDTGTELAQFILRTLRQAQQAVSLDDLKEAAISTNINFGDKKPGRVIHWALVGMARHGLVDKRDEKWMIMEGDKSQEPAEAGS